MPREMIKFGNGANLFQLGGTLHHHLDDQKGPIPFAKWWCFSTWGVFLFHPAAGWKVKSWRKMFNTPKNERPQRFVFLGEKKEMNPEIVWGQTKPAVLFKGKGWACFPFGFFFGVLSTYHLMVHLSQGGACFSYKLADEHLQTWNCPESL